MRGVVINVPLSLLKDRSWSKERFKILTCAIMMSCRYVNRLIYNPSIAKLVDVLHVSKPTAIKFKKKIIDSDLFAFDANRNTLYVRSFKSKDKCEFGKGRTRMVSAHDYCVKVPVEISSMKLRDAVKMLRKLMLEHVVKCNEGKESLNKPQEVKREAPVQSCNPITLRRMAKYISMSKATAGRYMKELVCEGRVHESEVVMELKYYTHSGGSIDRCRAMHPKDYCFGVYSKKYLGTWYWIVLGRMYSLTSDTERKRFQHVIYENKKGSLPSTKKQDRQVQSSTPGLILRMTMTTITISIAKGGFIDEVNF